MHLVIVEAERRIEADDIPRYKTNFAEELANWLSSMHPTAPQVKAHTIENNAKICELWRQVRSSRSP